MFIKVRVKTGERRESVLKTGEGKYEIRVRQKPLHNEANARVISLLSLVLQVPAKAIRFVSGQKSPSKLFEIK